MADARDFLPEAGPPKAEKSQFKRECLKPDELKELPGVYVVLGSGDTYIYKGSARDVRGRVAANFAGRVSRTRNRRPLNILHVEYTADYSAARKRENWLKSGIGRKWLKNRYAWVVEWQTQGT